MADNIAVIESGFEEILSKINTDMVNSHRPTLIKLTTQLEGFLSEINQYGYGKKYLTRKKDLSDDYDTSKNQINDNENLLLLMQRGELLIEQIRAKLAGEKTIINVGVDTGGKIYEAQITLDKLLNFSRVDIDSNKDLKLKSTGRKSDLLAFASKVKIIKNQGFLQQLLSLSNINFNKGRTYEYFLRKRTGEYEGSDSQLRIMSQGNEKGSHGGDVYYTVKNKIISEQIKYWGDNSFSFMTLTQIKDVLKSYVTAFKEFIAQKGGNKDSKAYQDLKKALIRDKPASVTEAAAAKEAQEYLEDMLFGKKK